MPYSRGDVLTTGTQAGVMGQTVVIVILPDSIRTAFVPFGTRTITAISAPVRVTLPPIGFFDIEGVKNESVS